MLWVRVASAVVVMVLVWEWVSLFQHEYFDSGAFNSESGEIEKIQRSFRISSIVAVVSSGIVAGLINRKDTLRVVLMSIATIAGFLCLGFLWEPVVSQAWIRDHSFATMSVRWDIQGAVTGAACMSIILDAVPIIRGSLRRRAGTEE